MQKDLKIRKILLPYDFSATAALSLDQAVDMAKRVHAELYLLHILETGSIPGFIAQAFSGFEKKVEEASTEKLRALADKLHAENGFPVHVLTDSGKISKCIAHTAKQADIDIILMGTHGNGGHSYIIGSNTTRTVQEAPCPVIAFQSHTNRAGFRKIALPIDDSPESRQKVNFGMEIARIYNAEVVVIGLMRNGGEDYERKFRIKIEQVEDFLADHNISVNIVYRKGEDIAKSTLLSIQETGADLVVIMTEQEPSISGLLMGSYASKIINGSTIPVMTVRPAEIDPDRITVSF